MDTPEPVLAHLKQFLDQRTAVGVARYGRPLSTDNGRDALIDALEEAADLLQYLAQAVIERDGHLPSTPQIS